MRGISTLLQRPRPEPATGSAEPRLIKTKDHVDYLADLLELIPLRCVRMSEVRQEKVPCFYLRHDVDHDLHRALDMAAVENRHGCRSTYFLLPPGSYGEKTNYYGTLVNGRVEHAANLIANCRRLIDLGHDIGFHNDLVAMALVTRQHPRDMLEREVEYFRKNHIDLVGTASHGSRLPVQLKFSNLELFKECVRRKAQPGRLITHNGWHVELHSLSLQDFGFQYEAYSLPRDSTFSDSGGNWRGKLAGTRIDRVKFAGGFELAEFRALFQALHGDGAVQALSILIHPCYWSLQ